MTIKEYPILKYLDNNELTRGIYTMLDNSGYNEDGIIDIEKSFKYFAGRAIHINHISQEVLGSLEKTPNFNRDKTLLAGTKESAGLLLLPKTILPDFSNVPEYAEANPSAYPINAILYSWLSFNNHDIIDGTFDPEDAYRGDEGRSLVIIPICDDRITQATDEYHMTSNDEIYGWPCSESEGREWYGTIHDMIMSLILVNTFPDVYDHIITNHPAKREIVVCNYNDIEMIA
ncbi:hypothetical protein [Pedobacter frigoris]|uniref:Uncharacterized protein n=1 Tax=Pedobacter frigoris TaxID=2571272 RepID=A0A4U1CM94_9SPHI|nr:hypothetical protein [Pedobacter frigoris]TKC07481.1 hypothetical protein FA047_09550 [Pedobacter frigoris]